MDLFLQKSSNILQKSSQIAHLHVILNKRKVSLSSQINTIAPFQFLFAQLTMINSSTFMQLCQECCGAAALGWRWHRGRWIMCFARQKVDSQSWWREAISSYKGGQYVSQVQRKKPNPVIFYTLVLGSNLTIPSTSATGVFRTIKSK